MVNRINITGATPKRIVITDKPQRRIEPEEFAKLLGAEPTGIKLPANADIIDVAEVGTQLIKKSRERFKELSQLTDGWLDGDGVALSETGLKWLKNELDKHYSDELPFPYIFPTPQGKILLEWKIKRHSISLEIDLENKTGDWHLLNIDLNFEATKQLNLSDPSQWQWVIREIQSI